MDRRHRHKRLDFLPTLRVLTEKFQVAPAEARTLLTVALGKPLQIELTGTVKACRDPKDDMFLERAALAKADLLIAGDKDPLVLKTFEGTRIITPSEYVHHLY